MFKNWDIDSDERKDFSGEILTIPKSKDGYLRNFKMYGKTVQNGTPTPESPIPVQNVPSSFDITSCGKNLFDASKISSTAFIVEENGRFIRTKSYAQDTGYWFQFLPNTKYTISFKGTRSGSNSGTYGNIVAFYAGSSIFSFGTTQLTGLINKTITTPATLPNNGLLNLYMYGTSANDGNEYGYTYEDLVITYEGVTDRAWEKYIGTTTNFSVKDTNNNDYELCSLSDGTCDEIDVDSGKIIKRVVGRQGGIPELNQAGSQLTGFTTGYFTNSAQLGVSREFSFMCNLLDGSVNGYTTNSPTNWIAPNNPANPVGNNIVILRVENRLIGATDDEVMSSRLIKLRTYLNDNNVYFTYPLATPQIYDLHPDEQKKIITVDSDKAYVYTNAEVQPEISANAISYGENDE